MFVSFLFVVEKMFMSVTGRGNRGSSDSLTKLSILSKLSLFVSLDLGFFFFFLKRGEQNTVLSLLGFSALLLPLTYINPTRTPPHSHGAPAVRRERGTRGHSCHVKSLFTQTGGSESISVVYMFFIQSSLLTLSPTWK